MKLSVCVGGGGEGGGWEGGNGERGEGEFDVCSYRKVVEPTHELAPVQLGDYYNILESCAEDTLCVCVCVCVCR